MFSNALPPLSLYVHIPWCIKKCPYCDFNSHKINSDGPPEELYIQCLINDLEQALPLIWGRTINSIFIGGGTPSLFSPQAINKLICNIRALVNLSPLAEITIEANPGTTDNTNLEGYAKCGINRVSFGIQSFNNNHLKTLGRIHNNKDSINAIKIAKQYFNNFNLDLIYGLPNQTLNELEDDINTAIDLSPTHLSCYNLTLEPNTEFFNKPPANIPSDDICHDMQDLINQITTKNQYKHYETSAYYKLSTINYQCKHNLNYWQFGDYLGIGAGSHSKITFHDKIIRQIRQKHPINYMKRVNNKLHIIEDKLITTKELPFEFMLNAMRLIDGFETTLFHNRTRMPFTTILPQLLKCQEKNLIELKNCKVIPTPLGQDFLNDILIKFL